LVLLCEADAPNYVDSPAPIIANWYLWLNGGIQDTQTFSLTLVDGLTTNSYSDVSQSVVITGTGVVTFDPYRDKLDHIQIMGAASFAQTSSQPGGSELARSQAGALVNAGLKLTIAAPANGLAAGESTLRLQLPGNVSGHIEYSTDLIHWMTLTNFAGTTATITIHDLAAMKSNQRFYRAVVP